MRNGGIRKGSSKRIRSKRLRHQNPCKDCQDSKSRCEKDQGSSNCIRCTGRPIECKAGRMNLRKAPKNNFIQYDPHKKRGRRPRNISTSVSRVHTLSSNISTPSIPPYTSSLSPTSLSSSLSEGSTGMNGLYIHGDILVYQAPSSTHITYNTDIPALFNQESDRLYNPQEFINMSPNVTQLVQMGFNTEHDHLAYEDSSSMNIMQNNVVAQLPSLEFSQMAISDHIFDPSLYFLGNVYVPYHLHHRWADNELSDLRIQSTESSRNVQQSAWEE
ncbi:hypothetical protein PNOK_0010400 [Pyrrhoderma noxium]|uniref:Zn(2)-C6 fungal-type domain-containing protein n=1 Tax=Pyrrhoderma noxium TaxID=2282107 RepID=A0A286UTY7_9AGAM|nr:hypothetical protein PNOK_0010400 [Pyrrhoderma noxium]